MSPFNIETPDRDVIVSGECAASSMPRWFDRLTLRTMRRGAEILHLGRRRLRLDEDAYIVVDGQQGRSSSFDGDGRVRPLVIAFREGSLARAMAALDAPDDEATPVHIDWLETLRPHNAAMAGHLAVVERHLREGDKDAAWWDERMTLLLAAAIDVERSLQGRERNLAAQKPSTRRELLRRVLLASDFIQSAYEEPIALRDIAAAAHLSSFHLVRLFQQAHGIAPHAYLTRKRVSVALRLIERTEMGLDEIAERAGFGTRSSLFRQLRRARGHGAAALRANASEASTCNTSA
jgi:AraC family transcriptional regulator